MDMARIYGDVFYFSAMGKRYLVIGSLPLYKELWREAGDRLTGRAPFASVAFLNPNSLGDILILRFCELLLVPVQIMWCIIL